MKKSIFKKPQKSRISSRARNINILLLTGFLAIIITVGAFIVNNTTEKASQNLARLYSLETVGKFSMYINRELVLMQRLSRSQIILDWLTSEFDIEKKTAAFLEIINYADMFENAVLYVGFHESLNEYAVRSTMSLEELVPVGKLIKEDPGNDWYYDCLDADTEYTLNIDIEKLTNIRRFWINHKVMNRSEVAGVFCTGLVFEDMVQELFLDFDSIFVKGFIVDKDGNIKMGSSVSGLNLTIDNSPIAIIQSYSKNAIGTFDNSNTEPAIIKLNKNSFRYASVAPIPGTDWLVVIFFNNEYLFSARNLFPLLITMLSAFIMFFIAERFFMRRIVLIPLLNLSKSISESEKGVGEIYGLERNDEIGKLANTIKNMKECLMETSSKQEYLIRTDQLTNIPNRRYFDEHLPIEWARAVRNKTPISMMMMDLDHFKVFNDTYGHLNGDKVLQQVARVLAQGLKRPTDFVVRWGGEEFAGILPDTDCRGAAFVAENLRKTIENEQIHLEGGIVTKTTVSIGVHTIIPTRLDNSSDFISRADDALYKAKATGRNKVFVYEEQGDREDEKGIVI